MYSLKKAGIYMVFLSLCVSCCLHPVSWCLCPGICILCPVVYTLCPLSAALLLGLSRLKDSRTEEDEGIYKLLAMLTHRVGCWVNFSFECWRDTIWGEGEGGGGP